MSGRLVEVGEKANSPEFDSAAADAARATGLSDAEIVELIGYLPPR